MADERTGEPVRVDLPEPLDRRGRLGPFPTPMQAVKFAAYAAVGGTVAAGLGPLWSVPFLAAGAVCSALPNEGGPLDEQVGRFLSYRWRRRRPRPPAGRVVATALDDEVLEGPAGYRVAIVEVTGVPVAFLPPADARSLFDGYRSMLRELDGGLVLQASVRPLNGRAVAPHGGPERRAEADGSAHAGYRELVRLLCQRRYRRSVLLVLWGRPGAEGERRLELAVGRLLAGLGRMDLRGQRLRGASLRLAAHEMGWGPGGSR